MRKLALLLLLGFSGASFAHNCPVEMQSIDAKLSASPTLSKDVADQVKKLRADGEAHHKAGRHDASMTSLGQAKKLLGI
jgi:hypothetical protein